MDWFNLNNLFNSVNSINCIKTVSVESINDISLSSNSINIFSMNIRSYKAHIHDLIILLESAENEFDVIVLCETWLKEEYNIPIKNYQVFHSLGIINHCDGVSVPVSNNCRLDSVEIQSINNCNSIKLTVNKNDYNFTVTGIYRSQCHNKDQFITSLGEYLLNENFIGDHILCGDININLFDDSIESNSYVNTLAKFGYTSAINDFTRITDNSKTCIDHIFINNYFKLNDSQNTDSDALKAYILKTSITDHFSTIITLEKSNCKSNTIDHQLIERRRINWKRLNSLITSDNWTRLYETNNADAAIEEFNLTINRFILSSSNTLLNNEYKNKNKKIKQWITKGLITSIRNREKLYNKLRKQPFNTILKQKYTNYRNLLNNLIKLARNLYYEDRINLAGNNSKKVWNLIKDAAGIKINNKIIVFNILDNDGTKLTDKKDIVQQFNTFFSNVGADISMNIKNGNFNNVPFHELNKNCFISNSIFLRPIEPSEIVNLINKCKNFNSFCNNT